MDYNIFGARLREYRRKHSVSLRFMAERLGLSQPYLSHVEQGKRAPLSLQAILKIQIVLELDDGETLMLAQAAASHQKGLCIRLGDIEHAALQQGGWMILHMLLYGSKKPSSERSK